MDKKILNELDLNDDGVLKYTQGIRKNMVDSILEDGFPTKARDQEVFLKALSDMDSAAHTNKKIGVSEKQSGVDLLVAQALAEIGNHFGSNNPFEGQANNNIPVELEIAKLPNANPVDGEKDIGVINDKFSDFVSKFEQ